MALDRDWAALAEGGKAVLGVGWGVLLFACLKLPARSKISRGGGFCFFGNVSILAIE